VRLLAVTTNERLSPLPGVPTMKHAGLANATMEPWWALYVPARTPPDIVARLDGWMNQIAISPETKEFLLKQGVEPFPGSPESTRKQPAATIEEWKRILTIAKIEPQ
jgi:tripartite-type tricarboxylate transporter receptor subunit TctC